MPKKQTAAQALLPKEPLAARFSTRHIDPRGGGPSLPA